MSQENVEIVRTMWAAYARRDWRASIDAYAEDVVWDDTRYRPDGAVHQGREAMIEVVRSWRGSWARYHADAEDVLDAGGDKVVAVLRETGEGKGGGVELTNRWGLVVTVRDEKIVHTVVYRTPQEALEAVGLSEEDAQFRANVSVAQAFLWDAQGSAGTNAPNPKPKAPASGLFDLARAGPPPSRNRCELNAKSRHSKALSGGV